MYGTRRGAWFSGFLVAVLMLFAGSAAAQTTGKIEGQVTDAQTGQPLVGAQVSVLGTNLGNLTNEDGYYFINNVPAGLQSVQAQYIGYRSFVVEEQRVLANQTMTVNFPLSTEAVALEAITVRGEANPLVPRDKTVSSAVVTNVDELPIDDVREVVSLQAGVVETGDSRGQVIRGGRPGEASIYIDGVLVRSFNSGSQGRLQVGTNSVEEVNVLLGGFGAEYGSAQSGVINYVTKDGGLEYSGAVNFMTDMIMPNDMRYGWSRVEASFGGPIVSNIASFHLGLTADGKEDANPYFSDLMIADSIPVQDVFFRPVAIRPLLNDAGEQLTDDAGNPLTFTEFEEFGDLGNRRPYSNQDEYTLNGTVRVNPTSSTRLSFGAVSSRNQGQSFNSSFQFRPKMIPVFKNKSTLFRMGIDQILFQDAARQANLRINLAYQDETLKNGQRADTVSLDPGMGDFSGFRFSDYELFFEDVVTFDKYMARYDSIYAGLSDNPLTLVEFIGLDPGAGEGLFGAQFGADNPYGILGFHRTRGLSGYFESQEKTMTFDADLDFQATRTHRLGAGVELYKKEVTNLGIGTTSTYFHDVYKVEPLIGAFWIKDRMDIGEMVLDIGLRYDFFDSDAEYPVIPGLVLPFTPDADAIDEQCGTAVNEQGLCSPAFMEQERISTLSPRLAVAFPISDVTNFRLSYGHFFQLPAFNDMFSSINTDLSRSNTNTLFGRPIDAMKAVQFEAGLSHLFNPETVLDISAYNKDKLSDAAFRIQLIDWPASRRGSQDGRVLTNLDFGNAKGIDLRLTRRVSDYFTTIVGYSLLYTKGTGSDPLSYVNAFGRFTDPVTGAPLSPAQALQYSDFDQRHKFTLSTTANFDNDVAAGSGWNPLLSNMDIAVTGRAGSGLPYTVSSTPSASGRGASGARFTELINSSRLPWNFVADARVTKGFEVGSNTLAAFVDVQNLLNTRNTEDVYGFTGSSDPGDITNEAGNPSADFVIADVTDPLEQLGYQRQQEMLQRYGLADDDNAILTAQEQKAARALDYIASERIETFFSTPRIIRVGLEWVF